MQAQYSSEYWANPRIRFIGSVSSTRESQMADDPNATAFNF